MGLASPLTSLTFSPSLSDDSTSEKCSSSEPESLCADLTTPIAVGRSFFAAATFTADVYKIFKKTTLLLKYC